jgi:hypothetical protein
MTIEVRTATCRCGQLKATCEGEPVRVSVCHCLDCQKRSGSADSGHRATYRFCPHCGSTVAFVIEGWPGLVAVPLGAFADLAFPKPRFSVYEHRKHDWVAIQGEDIAHSSTPGVPKMPGRRD